MTKQEAIEVLKNNYPKMCKMVNGRYQGGFDNTESDFGQALTMAISALKEVQQYREIGSVEECREVVEKQKPKKPVLRNDNGKLRKSCPVCGCFFSPLSRSCPKCGQAILQENKDD